MEIDRLDKARTYIEQIKGSMTELLEECEHLSGEISFYDKELSSFYHRIEFNKYNPFSSHKLVRDMRDLLEKRRNVKFEAMTLSVIKDVVFGLDTRLQSIETKYFNNPKYEDLRLKDGGT